LAINEFAPMDYFTFNKLFCSITDPLDPKGFQPKISSLRWFHWY